MNSMLDSLTWGRSFVPTAVTALAQDMAAPGVFGADGAV
jgi:hypothetical protein